VRRADRRLLEKRVWQRNGLRRTSPLLDRLNCTGAVWWLSVVQCCYTVLSSSRIGSWATAVYYISRESKTTRNVSWSRASVCVSVCLSVCLSAAACLQYCTDPDVTWGSGRGCPLVVHYWADLQSVHGMRCYGNIMEMRGRAQW